MKQNLRSNLLKTKLSKKGYTSTSSLIALVNPLSKSLIQNSGLKSNLRLAATVFNICMINL